MSVIKFVVASLKIRGVIFLSRIQNLRMSFRDLFSRVASGYASYRPTYPAALFEWIASVPANRNVAWDCACGSGQATVSLAQYFKRVIATDASSEQIKAAPRDSENIQWCIATAEQSGLEDRSIDLVTVAQALHWFNFPPFYTEVNRVLREDGAIVVWTYGMNQVEGDDLDEVARDFYANLVGPYWPPERSHVENEYRTIPFPFNEVSAPSFQMTAEWSLEQLLGYFRTWSATRGYIAATGNDPVRILGEKLAARWGPAQRARRITWPLTVRAGRKR